MRLRSAEGDADKPQELKKAIADAQRDFEHQGEISIETLLDGILRAHNVFAGDVSVLARHAIHDRRYRFVHQTNWQLIRIVTNKKTLRTLQPVESAHYRFNIYEPKSRSLRGTQMKSL